MIEIKTNFRICSRTFWVVIWKIKMKPTEIYQKEIWAVPTKLLMFQQLSTATVQCVGSTSLCCDLDININAMCFDLLNRVLGMNAFDVFHPLTPVPKILTQAANVKKSAKNYYINCRHFLKFLYTIITIPNHLSFSFLFFS